MVDLMMHHLTNLLFFGIFLYYYINLNSSIIFYLSCGDIYLSFDISLLAAFECDSLAGFFEILVILSAIKLPTRSPLAFKLLFCQQFLMHLL